MDESGGDGGVPPTRPTPPQVAQGVIDLLGEVDEAFSSDRWAILDTRRQHATWLLCDGAALRHCCRLLDEIEVAAAAFPGAADRCCRRPVLAAVGLD